VTSGSLHPKQAKMNLAGRIVADFHDKAAASAAATEFDSRFSKKAAPTDVRIVELSAEEWASSLEKRLVRSALAESTSDARRKIAQGGVRINGEKAAIGAEPPGDEYLLQAGKLGAVRIRRAG